MDDDLLDCCKINFYGSEEEVVKSYIDSFSYIRISSYTRRDKDEIKEIQKKSHFLIIALGETDFEKSVLTGKFYEYLETGRKIIALCDEESELATLINSYKLGIATRDEIKIKNYINLQKNNGLPLSDIPAELTRSYQNEILLRLVEKVVC